MTKKSSINYLYVSRKFPTDSYSPVNIKKINILYLAETLLLYQRCTLARTLTRYKWNILLVTRTFATRTKILVNRTFMTMTFVIFFIKTFLTRMFATLLKLMFVTNNLKLGRNNHL